MATQAIRWMERWATLGLAAAAISLAGCGGGKDANAPPALVTVVIKGVVYDDPIEGATVTITSLANNAVIATTLTGTGGAYTTPPIAQADLVSGYKVLATGGVMLGKAFVGTLGAVYGATSDYTVSNANLATTIVLKQAEALTGNEPLLTKVGNIIASWKNLGKLAIDVSVVPLTDPTYQLFRQLAITMGVDAATSWIANVQGINATLPADGSTVCTFNGRGDTCSARFGSAAGAVFNASGMAQGSKVVDIPANAAACNFVVHADVSEHAVQARVEFPASGQPLGCVLSLSRPISLTLPPAPAPATRPGIDHNCAGSPSHAAMRVCVTHEAGIPPSYFVVDTQTHRIAASTYATLSPPATLERRYGSDLKRSLPAATTHSSAAAVLFIHGFTFEKFGGGDATWGQLPALVKDLVPPSGVVGFEPYEFQWNTDANFYDVAQDLARAIDYAYTASGGRKVHIVAHSFGGVLARTVLQRVAGGLAIADWSSKVASLTTVGSPHAGIHDNGAKVGGVDLPVGWALQAAPETWCLQISCYQAGLRAAITKWAEDSLSRAGDVIAPGYVAAALHTTRSQLPADLRFQVLIGQNMNRAGTNSFGNGDNLISYYGQRFEPKAKDPARRDALYFEHQIEGTTALVTERILALEPGVNAFPGDVVGATQLSEYLRTTARSGYIHADAWLLSIGSLGDNALEVQIPANCGDAKTCRHDTWVNVKELLLSFFGGPASPNFPMTTGPAATVSGASCTPPIVGQLMICTLTGSNLPDTVRFIPTNCSPSPMTALPGGSGTQRQFTCTPVTVGVSVLVAYTVPNSAGQLPAIPTVTAINPPWPTTSGVGLTDTGITANQCREVGTDAFVSCGSVGALALSSRQDGMVGRDADVSSNSGADGKLGFSYRTVAGGCVQDNVTGLMWEVKTADGGLRDLNNAYTNFDDPLQPQSSNVNPTQAQIDAATNSVGFMKAVNSQSLCGFNDWRMPTVDELQGLVDYGGVALEPSIDATWFPNTRVGGFWTASRSPLSASGAWIVYFDGGNIGSESRAARFYRVRLVRNVR